MNNNDMKNEEVGNQNTGNSNMVKCTACGKDIAKGVNKCIHCGKDQRNFFLRHKVLTGILVIVVIGVFGTMFGDSDEAPKSEEASSSVTDEVTQDEPEEAIEDKEFSVGEKVELDGQVVEVTGVEKSQGSDFDKPAEGKEYVVVTVSIVNDGDKEISYNPFNFKMKNSNGQIETEAFTTIDNETSLSSGQLASGGNVEGTLVFEQPIDDELQLIFEPGFWDDTRLVFNLR